MEMIEALIAIIDWYTVFLGVLAAALFWLLLKFGQWFTFFIGSKWSLISKQARISWLITRQTKYELRLATSDTTRLLSLTTLLYRSARPFLRSIMWLTGGLSIEFLLRPAGIIGYAVCLYYLFKTYEVISPLDDYGDLDESLKKINIELQKLQSS